MSEPEADEIYSIGPFVAPGVTVGEGHLVPVVEKPVDGNRRSNPRGVITRIGAGVRGGVGSSAVYVLARCARAEGQHDTGQERAENPHGAVIHQSPRLAALDRLPPVQI